MISDTRTQRELLSAEAVARYFLQLAAAADEPTPITQMQLHKLLYYAQGWCLATRERPLFPARFQAWVHGPVEVGVYPKFADYDSLPIARHEASDELRVSLEDRAIIESVWRSYGRYSAWQLREMTHNESPWKEARGALPEGAKSKSPMSEESIKGFFLKLHEANCRRIGMTPAQFTAALQQAKAGETIPFEDIKAEFGRPASSSVRKKAG